MKKKINIIIANPAGNVTIFVKDKFERSKYQDVAKQLLDMKQFGGEQVAFILETPACGRADGKVEMCGLEFCGNASRAFGLIKAKEMGISGEGKIFVDVSGCNEILSIDVNTKTGYTKVKMPNPLKMTKIDLRELQIGDDVQNLMGNSSTQSISALKDSLAPENSLSNTILVDLGGIMHVIVQGIEASKTTFDIIKNFVMKKFNPPAMGVMFYNSKDSSLIPVVYVKDVDTTYFEGSCGSGVTACGGALGISLGDGIHRFTFKQPGGIIDSAVEIAKGEIKSIYIEGKVELSEEIEVEIEI